MTDRITSYQQAIDWIFGLINYERKPGRSRDFRLDRTHALLEAVGNPHESIPVAHIAGTKGKGSTATMLAAMLQGSGLTTGLFTSPHITRFEERFTVNGEQASEAEIVGLVQVLQAAVEHCGVMPTYFEAAMVLAWCFYRDHKVDIAVLEVGLGGRLDATNVCHPKVCVITSISYDHMNVLGDTLDKIAGEKAGIIKPGVPVVSGVTDEPAKGVIRERAAEHNCKLFEVGDQVRFEYNRSSQPATIDLITPHSDWPALPVPLAGEHQGQNLALAVTAIDLLRENGFQIEPDQARAGLVSVNLPGRIEIIDRDPLIVVDSAHNEASIAALVSSLDELSTARPRVAIFATTKQKNAKAMLAHLLPAFDHIVFTQYLKNPRAVARDELLSLAKRTIEPGGPTLHLAETPTAALEMAKSIAGVAEGMICTTGSFFIAAEVRELIVDAD